MIVKFPQAKDLVGDTGLSWAARAVGRMDCVRCVILIPIKEYRIACRNFAYHRYLVNRGADIESKNSKGQSPLFSACAAGNLECVKFFILECGAATDIKGSDGMSLLTVAKEKGQNTVVEFLTSYLSQNW